MPKDVDRGMAAGFESYTTKPLQIDRLTACLVHSLKIGDMHSQP